MAAPLTAAAARYADGGGCPIASALVAQPPGRSRSEPGERQQMLAH